MAPQPQWTRADVAAVGGLTLVGSILRFGAMFRLGQHIDEAASAMGALCTARNGAPMFPSGVLYLQGATLSYLLAPAIRLGLDPESPWVRLVSVVPSAAAVPLAFVVARRLGLSGFTAIIATAWVALDPLAVEWAAHLRPYAMLQFFTLAAVGAFLSIRPGRSLPAIGWGLAFLAGIYTHVAIALLLPALAIVTLFDDWRDTRRWTALVAAGAAPLSLLVINKLFGVSSAGDGDPGLLAFVGNHLVSLGGVWSPDFTGWRAMYASQGIAAIVAVAVGIAVTGQRRERLFLALYGVPVMLVSMLTVDQMGRYLLLISAFGWMMIAAAADHLGRGRTVVLAAVGVALVVANSSGVIALYDKPNIDPDYGRAFDYVRSHKEPGELVLSAMTPAVWLAQGGSGTDLMFLAGPAGSPRAKRYTRPRMAGRVDYWANVPALTTVKDLCAALAQPKRSWLILDQERLQYALAGPMSEVIHGATKVLWRGPEGALVNRADPVLRWSSTAQRHCSVTAPKPPVVPAGADVALPP